MPPTAALSIRDLKFRYPPGADDAPAESGEGVGGWIVDIPAFDLARGEQALLTAGSGAGKSTLLSLIAGLLDPDPSHGAGTIEVAGTNLLALHGAARDLFRGRSIGMIFQTFNLLHGFSALENVMAALMFSAIPPREHRARALALLERLGIARPNADPDRLSVGQQQRVAVARAVACGPALVLADEPTASLDPENSANAMDLIQSVCRESGAALLCVSHDPSMAERFTRRVGLRELSAAPAAVGG
ncbi:MAG: ABC transporter ATP-binding protein [Phycisphaerales bacterium]|nr:ABC transporter ATP-binding protein [Phycisphaerales bacterium]